VASFANAIRLMLLDVDGVLTDGGILLDGAADDPARESKRFYVRDGSAITYLQRAGIEVGLITGRQSPVVARRAAELGITLVIQGTLRKEEAYLRLLADRALTDANVAFVGDDLLDLPLIRRVALSAAPSDAAPEVRDAAMLVTRARGGAGAVRETAELLLRLRGEWADVIVAPWGRQ
jgi:3-deoxy-D-manno-octulosonate 8-phosphate phosphatase (KDO 8-P phosphatase)